MTRIWLRGEGGAVFEMDLPLSPPVQQQYDKDELVRVNPDGSDWKPPAKPARKAATKTPAGQ